LLAAGSKDSTALPGNLKAAAPKDPAPNLRKSRRLIYNLLIALDGLLVLRNIVLLTSFKDPFRQANFLAQRGKMAYRTWV
jgi:hypothetical protein